MMLILSVASGSCQIPTQSVAVSSVPSWFTHCSGENGVCTFAGPAQVIYGTASGYSPLDSGGRFFQQTVNGGASCSNSAFGDPASGQSKACWIGPVPGAGAGSIAETGGSNYTFFVQNQGNWDDNQRVVVGLYHLDPTLVEAQLRQMYQGGQKKVALFIWYMPFDNSLSPANGIPATWPDVWGAYVNSAGGTLSAQAQSNLKAVLQLVQSIGYDQVTLRFAPVGVANPTTWGNVWKESTFQEDEQFVFNTRQLMERTLSGSSIRRLYDLGVEEAGVPHNLNRDGITYTDGQSPQWTRRLWADYIHSFGSSDSYGFSIAYSYGTLKSAIAEYDAAGQRPNTYGLDIYDTGQVWNVYQELYAAGEPGKPVIVQETQYNDVGIAQDFQTALQHIPLTISYVDQWPTNSNTPNADGMSPPTNFGNFGGTTLPSGTLVGYPCTITVGQQTCTTTVSWSTSNSANAALYVNGVQAVNLPNITSTLTGTTTVTLSSTPTNFVLAQTPVSEIAAAPAAPAARNSRFAVAHAAAQNVTTTLSLVALNGTPPSLTNAGVSGSSIWGTGTNISTECSVNLFDPSGSSVVPVASVTNVNCLPNSISFVMPSAISTYAAINVSVVNSNRLASGTATIALQQVPKLSMAGLGGTSIWAVGAGISAGCYVSLYDPNGSATVPMATVTQVNCAPDNLSFALPAFVMNQYTSVNMSVTDSDGLSSGKLTVSLPFAQIPSLSSAGLGGANNQFVWAVGSKISAGCSVKLYDPNDSASVPVATVANVGCSSNSLSFALPTSVIGTYKAISVSVVNANGLSSEKLTLSLPFAQVPTLSAAGLGGAANQSIWAVGTGISAGCSVNLYDPNGSSTTPVATVTSVNCSSTSLSFAIPTAVLNNYPAISIRVINPGGYSSELVALALPFVQTPTLWAAGLGGASNQFVWATGSGISAGCSVNLYDPNGSATLPVATVTSVSCGSGSISFAIPANVLSNYSVIALSVVNPGNISSASVWLRIQ